jgi:hypothetical protein
VAPCGFHRSPNSLPTMTDIKNSDFFRLADTSPDPLVRCFLRSHVEWNQPSRTPTRDGWKVILAAVRLSQPLAAYGSRQKLAGKDVKDGSASQDDATVSIGAVTKATVE